MIIGIFKLAILLALVRWAEQSFDAPTRWLAASMGEGMIFDVVNLTTVLSLGAILFFWRLLSLPLWLSRVPLRSDATPRRHPLSRRGLGFHLRVRPRRFFIATLFEMWTLSAFWTVISEQVHPFTISQGLLVGITGLGVGDWRDVLIDLIVLHLLFALVLWFVQRQVEKRMARNALPFGFVRYHLARQPVRRFGRYQVLGVHLACCLGLAIAVGETFALTLALSSLLGVFAIGLIASVLTIFWEGRRDDRLSSQQGLAANADYEARQRFVKTVTFLHPGVDYAAMLALPAPSPTSDPSASSDPVDPEPQAAAQNAESTSPPPLELPAPEESSALEERPDPSAEPQLTPEAQDSADVVILETPPDPPLSTAQQEEPADSRWVWQLPLLAFVASMSCLSLYVAWQWLEIPNAKETRQLARSAHVHVRKTGSGENAKLELTGNRFDYSLNTSLENVSEHFVNAVIASEDHRFFEHGPSYMAAKFVQAAVLCVARKLNVFSRNAGCAGNSTITQQLARNLLLSESRTVTRKLIELLWAIKMEMSLSKEEILEFYVNRLYLGNGNYGVEMSARDYFGKPASALNIFESAVLAAAIKRPGWNVEQNIAAARERAELIVVLMDRHGYVPDGTRLPKRFTPRRGTREPARPFVGHLFQWIRADALDVLRDKPDGNYKIVTTLNAEVEIYAEHHVSTEVKRLRRAGVPVSQAAVVVMRPDGRVLAMVGGVGKGVSARGFNRAKFPRGMVSRPPASSFKPFVYLAALESGLGPDSLIDASPVSISIAGEQKPYEPRNHDLKSYGLITLREGLVKSVNTAAVRLLHDRLGFDAVFGVLDRLGIESKGFQRQWGIALGSQGVPLVEMTTAYATFANGGRQVKARGFTEITTTSGKVVWRAPSSTGRQVFRRRNVEQLTEMLREVVASGTGTRARRGLSNAVKVAGKTGTGDSFVDAWFVGYTDDLVIGVWMGNDRPRQMPGLYGGTAPARTFNFILRDLLEHTDLSG